MIAFTRVVVSVGLLCVVLCVVTTSSVLAINRQMRRPVLAFNFHNAFYGGVAVVDVERGILRAVSSGSDNDYCLLDEGQKVASVIHLDPEEGAWVVAIFDLNTEQSFYAIPIQFYSGNISAPVCSPDGQWVAFAFDEGIMVVDQYGSHQQLVTTTHSVPTWSLDSQRIRFVATNDDSTTLTAYEVNLDGTNVHEIPSTNTFNLSPDNNRSLFVDENDVWVRDVATDELTQLTFTPEEEKTLPYWSTDGAQIAFVTRGYPFGCRLWVMNNDGSNLHTVTIPPLTRCRDLAWSLDNTQIALSGQNDCWPDDGCPTFVSDNIYVVNTDGSGFRQIVEGAPGSDYSTDTFRHLRWIP